MGKVSYQVSRVIEADKVRVMESLLTKAGFGRFQYALLFLCGVAQLGAYAAYTSGLIAAERFALELSVSSAITSWPEWIVKSAFAWIAGIFIDKFGRSFSFKLALLLGTVFTASAPFATSLELYLVCRTFGCFTLGAVQVVTYVLVAEFTPRLQRSRALFFLVLTDCLGTLYGSSMMVLPFGEHLGDPLHLSDWRCRLLFGMLPLGAAFLLSIFLLPHNSPAFLIVSGKPDDAYRVIEGIAKRNQKHSVIDFPLTGMRDFSRAVAALAAPPRDRGTFTSIKQVSRSAPLVAQWSVQAIAYWGAMSALPRLYHAWRPATEGEFFNLEVLLLLYVFELFGIVIAAIGSSKTGSERTLLWFSAMGAALIFVTAASVAMNAPWFLSASVCGMFAVLTPVWGLLFVITTETYPVQCRGTALGLMMATRVVQGVLELSLPALDVNSWLTVTYACIAGVFALGGVYGVKKFLITPRPTGGPAGSPNRTRSWSSPRRFEGA
jgi:MFS family permease